MDPVDSFLLNPDPCPPSPLPVPPLTLLLLILLLLLVNPISLCVSVLVPLPFLPPTDPNLSSDSVASLLLRTRGPPRGYPPLISVELVAFLMLRPEKMVPIEGRG